MRVVPIKVANTTSGKRKVCLINRILGNSIFLVGLKNPLSFGILPVQYFAKPRMRRAQPMLPLYPGATAVYCTIYTVVEATRCRSRTTRCLATAKCPRITAYYGEAAWGNASPMFCWAPMPLAGRSLMCRYIPHFAFNCCSHNNV